MTRQKPTKLRPAEGGRYHEPVGPSPEVVAMIRAHDDATEKRRAMIEATAKAIVEARAANAATDAASSLKVGDALDRSMFKPDTPGFVLQPSAVGTVGGQEFKVGDRVRSRDHRAWSDARGLRVSAVTERNVVCVDAHGAHCFTWFPWELEHVAAEPAKAAGFTPRDVAFFDRACVALSAELAGRHLAQRRGGAR